jgi:hypothetical protein
MLQNALLNFDNYGRGFLIDEELMAGVSEDRQKKGFFVAFVINHVTGESLGTESFNDLSQALARINQIPRNWAYEKSSACGGGACGKTDCKPGEAGACGTAACPL